MTATVSIAIGGNVLRTLRISRLTNTEGRDPLLVDADEINLYEVKLLPSHNSRKNDYATFWHRYGDSEITLVAEAIQALNGMIPRREPPPKELTHLEQLDEIHRVWAQRISEISFDRIYEKKIRAHYQEKLRAIALEGSSRLSEYIQQHLSQIHLYREGVPAP